MDSYPEDPRTTRAVSPNNIAREKAAITNAAVNLEKHLSVLHDELNQLEARLTPVTSPQTPQQETIQNGNPPEGSSMLYYHLAELNGLTCRAIDKVAELTRRVEV